MLSKSRQSNTSRAAPLGKRKQFHLTRTKSPCLLSQVHGKGKERMRLPTIPLFQRQGVLEFQSFGSCQRIITQVGEVYSRVNWPTRFNIQIRHSLGSVQAFYGYIDQSIALEFLITWTGLTDGQLGTQYTLFSSLLTNYFPTNFY